MRMDRVAPGARQPVDFFLEGQITQPDGRLVLATRLFHRREEGPVWTATLWRSDSSGAHVAAALAADVAEALYGHLARLAVTKTRGSP